MPSRPMPGKHERVRGVRIVVSRQSDVILSRFARSGDRARSGRLAVAYRGQIGVAAAVASPVAGVYRSSSAAVYRSCCAGSATFACRTSCASCASAAAGSA
jgi:hypothetical protein